MKRKEASLSPATSKLDIPTSVTSPCSMGGATLDAATSQEETLGIHDTARKGRSMDKHNSSSAHDDDKGESSPSETVREGGQMRIKELGRQVREGLDEIGRVQQQYEKHQNEPKVNNKSVKCPCCDEVIFSGDHICETYESLCQKINQGKFNSNPRLTDYQFALLERR